MPHVFSNRAIWRSATQLHGNLIQEIWLYITHVLFILLCSCYVSIFPSLFLRKWQCVNVDISNKQNMFSKGCNVPYVMFPTFY